MKNILVTTEWKGVFFAQVSETEPIDGRTIKNLKNARMAIYWGTTRGVLQLAESGPTKSSRISAPADIETLHGVTSIINVTDEAAKKWTSS